MRCVDGAHTGFQECEAENWSSGVAANDEWIPAAFPAAVELKRLGKAWAGKKWPGDADA